ncbi:MAG: prepilin-type N-terminal cleavage/methylation domain-containing protein [Candidatus Omnitrophota bacterium]
MKKGFTLIEVLIVVIILGILATIAVPQFTRVVERARRGEALTCMAGIQTGQRIYSLDMSIFTNNIAELDAVIANNKYWAYNMAGANATAFNIRATRSGSAWVGQTILLNQNGLWAGTYEFVPSNN